MECVNCDARISSEICPKCGTKNKFEEKDQPKRKSNFELYIFSVAEKYNALWGNCKRLERMLNPDTENYHIKFLITAHEEKMQKIKSEAIGHWSMVEAQIDYLNRLPEKFEDFFDSSKVSKKTVNPEPTPAASTVRKFSSNFLPPHWKKFVNLETGEVKV